MTLTRSVVFGLLALAATLDAHAEEGAGGAYCCGDVRSITRLLSASEESSSLLAVVEAQWTKDLGRLDVRPVDGVDFDQANISFPNDAVAVAIARECERLDYRTKLRSAFKDIQKLHAQVGRGGLERALLDYVGNKAVAHKVNAVQKSIPIRLSASLSGNDVVFKLHSPCGFTVELATIHGRSNSGNRGLHAVAEDEHPVAGLAE